MRLAIPVTQGRLAMHFGHCEEFALIDVDTEKKEISGQTTVAAPPHEPGLLPGWLAGQQVGVVLAGGMGSRAIQAFAASGVRVIVGVPELDPMALANAFLGDELETRGNACDH